ncbi:hypothetical protein [Sphingomonas sp. AAP5]|uniref:hypothetical protein n=1 Tax=Sphingomonas sp. AAP5 TaxID=1523415 RepID=UPI001404C9BF|nr:hypothetical protein [Sphingomonas sp. AAP5]
MYSGRDLMIDGDAALLRSSFVPQIKRVFYISHHRSGTGDPFLIQHIFAAAA